MIRLHFIPAMCKPDNYIKSICAFTVYSSFMISSLDERPNDWPTTLPQLSSGHMLTAQSKKEFTRRKGKKMSLKKEFLVFLVISDCFTP